MVKPSLDEYTDKILQEENPTAKAVDALINVDDREAGKSSEVELKTDLTENEVKMHTVLDTLSTTLEMSEKVFSAKSILASVIEKKERKSLSKNRMSRSEIVTVARQPDMNLGFGEPHQKQGFIKRFFTSKNDREGK